MTRTAPTTDEQLFELLRKTDPLADNDRSPALEASAVSVERDRLLQQILSSERISTPRPDWQHAWQRRRLVLSVVSGGGVAAVAAVLAFTAGDAPSVAFAGWSADPTAPASEQVQAAKSECQRNSALASQTPALADTRGPYTLLVYAGNSGSLCITGASLQSPTGEPSIVPFGTFLTASKAANDTSVAPDAIRTAIKGGASAKVSGSARSAEFGLDVGRVGENVTAVTLVLADGSHVEATTSNGWFAAWWPGDQSAQTAEITTTSGANTQQLMPTGTPSLPATGQEASSPTR
jgi:hypothetical protein